MSLNIRHLSLSIIHYLLFLSFALGNDINLHSVLGIQMLLAMGSVVDLVKVELVCSEFNETFLL